MVKRLLQLLSIVCALAAAAPMAGAQPVVRIVSALTVEDAGPRFPQGTTARTVSLPDAWSESRPATNGPVWYRLSFLGPSAASDPPPLMAVWIERACSQLLVQLNGRTVFQEATAPPATTRCNHPLWIALPAEALMGGTNVLDIRLAGWPLDRVASRERAAGLSLVHVGPQAALLELHAATVPWRAGIAQAITLALGFVGAFMLLQGWSHPRERHINWFGGLCLAVALAQLPQWLRDVPLDSAWVEFLAASLLPWMTLAAAQFLLRHAGRRERVADLVLPAQCVLMPLSLVLLGPNNLQTAIQFWSTLFIIEILVAATLHLGVQWHVSRRSFWMMCALLAAIGLGEAAAFFGSRLELPELAVAAQVILPSVLMLLALRLIQQRGRALESAETSRALLEQRVAEVKAEIEANYRQLSELRVVQVTDRERKRIAADLHDDLGAKLLTIVHTSESERISTLAREALEEMRLSVRGLTGKPVRLEDALGDWRAEVISRLGQAGIEAVWNMPVEDLPHTLPARAFVQTTRIIREAVNNIIKHSGASQCAVRCNVAGGDFQLVIQDNGKGIAVEVDGRLDRGHGLASMKGRAKQLQGQCLVESGPGYGTVIRLTIPLEPTGHAV
ncbi:MAG: sensor histidine kinase [Rubrivivax sp.]|nr:sensor histidine kinase [Rubrivivax sp.]